MIETATATRILVVVTVVASASVVGACTAHADPGKVPDLSGYTQVDPHEYAIDTSTPGIHSTGTYFLTPDGIICGFSNPPGAACSGNNFPNIAPVAQSEGGLRVNGIGTDFPLQETTTPLGTDGRVHDQPLKTLPPFHSITVDGVTCGVDNARGTACKDGQGHGFMLSPAWTGLLPRG